MLDKIVAEYPKGNSITKQVKRAKNRVRMEKEQAAKIDLGLGSAAGVLTFLALKAMDIVPTIGPIATAVLLTPIFGKLSDRYENVKDAKQEYKNLKDSPEYQAVLKRHDYMQKRKMVRKHVYNA